MKFDKEKIVKHHFWILLGLFTPLVMVALILLWTSVAGDIAAKTAELEKIKKNTKGIARPDVKNLRWVEALRTKEGLLSQEKDRVWEEHWKNQQAFMTWPPTLLTIKGSNLKDAYFGDQINPPVVRDRYAHDKDTYIAQIEAMVAQVEPVNAKGEGVVQFLNGWRSVIKYVPRWVTDRPSSEEVWLAQEDLWVQRELLGAIRQANNFLAVFRKEPVAAQKGYTAFLSPIWRLELSPQPRELRWTITNIGTRQQFLGIKFDVQFQGSNNPTFELFVDGEPLSPGQTLSGANDKFKSLGYGDLAGVKQKLDWRTAAVKRIDQINLTANAARTAQRQFQPSPVFTDPNNPDQPPPPVAAPFPGGEGRGPGMPGMNVNSNPTENGLERNRYVYLSPQVRRTSVGLVLIVDQSRVQDVLTALVNSRLRMQVTQVSWQHYRGSIKPADETTQPGGPLARGGEGAVRPMTRPFNPADRGEAVGRPPGPPGPGFDNRMIRSPYSPQGAMTATNAADEAANLIEVAIYGVVSLYQKYPPKPADASAPPPAPEVVEQ